MVGLRASACAQCAHMRSISINSSTRAEIPKFRVIDLYLVIHDVIGDSFAIVIFNLFLFPTYDFSTLSIVEDMLNVSKTITAVYYKETRNGVSIRAHADAMA